MAVDMSKFTARFVEESRDRLSVLLSGIASLEAAAQGAAQNGTQGAAQVGAPGAAQVEGGTSPTGAEGRSSEPIDDLFRAAHTIKGSARMLGQGGIGEMAHRLEDLLDALRSRRVMASENIVRALYGGVDALSALVERLASGEKTPAATEDALLDLSRAAATATDGAATDPTAPDPAAAATPDPAARPPAAAPTTASPAAPDTAVAAPAATRSPGAPESVRVRVEKLDELVRLTGESIAARAHTDSRIEELAAIERMAFPAATGDADRLRMLRERIGQYRRNLRTDALARSNLDGELHAAALAMRMLPLSIVFEPAARMARDIARSLGKEIDCVVSGADIELDRQIIDRLGEPIIHLLRNAIDHGVEEASLRGLAGKTPRARICLSARQAESSVLVEVSDDGRGLDVTAIREKALRTKIISAEKAASLSAREISDLVFLPGFSTSPIVTDLSGRGVGLDIVRKTVVESLKGTIIVESTPGHGARFTLRLPPTLAIMRVLFAKAGGEIYGFASHDVTAVIDIGDEAVMNVAGGRAAVIRNEFVPVRSLAEALSAAPPSGHHASPGRDGAAKKAMRLLVVNDGSERLALSIDALVDEREVVVKPLPTHMRGIALVSGIITIGSNRLVCLLNAPALVGSTRRRRIVSAAEGDGIGETARAAEILIVDDSLNTREIERDVLEAHGYRITLAEDGIDGLAKARAGKFDAILTDVEMPGMDGFTLTEKLRAEEDYRDAPIIILTSRSRDEDRRRGMRAGADAYIVKGDFEQGSLLETLRALGL